MDGSIIFVRTEQGNRALLAPGELAASLTRVLAAVDGVASVDLLCVELDDLAAAELEQLLTRLLGDRLIRDSAGSPSLAAPAMADDEQQRLAQELRDKVKARREGHGRLVSAVGAPVESRQNLVDQEAEERSRREAEERTRLMAEEQARIAAEEAARILAQEEARRAEAEEQTRQEAERRRRPAEETQRQQAGKAAASMGGKGGLRTRRRWGRLLALAGVAVIVGLAISYLASIQGRISRIEQSLSAQFQQPVRIKALGLGLVPRPHLRLDELEIGGAGQIRIARIRASGGIGALFGDGRNFTSVEVESPTISEEGMGWILFGRPLTDGMRFGAVSVTNARIDSRHLGLPPFNATLQTGTDRGWNTMVLVSTDKATNLTITARDASVQFDLSSVAFRIPFGSALTLDEFVAKGAADRNGLTLTEFKGFLFGGALSGTARLAWETNWDLAGDLTARQIDAARILPRLLAGARIGATARYSMRATEAGKLFAAPRLEGDFAIPHGTLLGIDLGSLLLRGTGRGDTRFAELGGRFVYDAGIIQLRELSLNQDALHGQGMADVGADGKVRGRLAAQLRLSAEQRRANLVFTGTPEKLEWSRQ